MQTHTTTDFHIEREFWVVKIDAVCRDGDAIDTKWARYE
jgi:hypothetical protein